MSYLSVFCQYHAKARVAFRVPREAFEPAPKVDSAVLVLEPYPGDDRLDAHDEDRLWRVVQAVVPRAAQDAPQRAAPGSCRSSPRASRRRSTRSGSPATAGPRPSRWGSGCALAEALGEIPEAR